jgi:ATP/maltotriose-dependent transcriptional regulator MalT
VVGGLDKTLARELLTTKLAVPIGRANLVARAALMAKLDVAPERKLTLVSAPAGFGKTTLLAEWARSSVRPVAWLSLDAGDNDAARFAAYLTAALQRVDPGVGPDVVAPVGAMNAVALEGHLTALVNGLATARAFVLVLDDYHLITDDGIHAGVTFLLEHMPPGSELAIATRADPPLPLARLRGRGQLAELRASDLEFTAEEAHDFFSRTMGLDLDPQAATALQVRTEGWVAGLQLAGLSLQGRDDVEGFLAAFAGSNRYILDYLVEEVLARQPAAIQDFLLRTSILSRLTGALCDSVTDMGPLSDGAASLASLEAANLFTFALDDDRRWYRYHALFADCLRSRLGRSSPGLVPELHRRAAGWYASNGLPEDAVGHALLAGDAEYAAGLIEHSGLDLLARSEFATVCRWLDAVPAEIVERRPALSIFHGWALLDRMELDRARRCLERPDDAAIRPDLRLLRAALQARLSWVHGEPGLVEPVVGLLLASENGPSDPPVPDARLRAFITVFAASQLGAALRLQGRLGAAIRILLDAFERVASVERDGRLAAALAYAETKLGQLLYEQDDLDAAERHYLRAIKLAREGGSELAEALSEALLAAVREARGRTAEALLLIDRAERSARRRDSQEEVIYYAAQDARLARARGDLDAVARWTREGGPRIEASLSSRAPLGYIEGFDDGTYARALVALGRTDEAARIVTSLLERAEATGQTGNVIDILVVAAQVFAAQGETDRAMGALERALALAEPEGYVRTFIDEGAAIRDLLRAGAKRFSNRSPTYLRALLAALEHGPGEMGRSARRAASDAAAGDPTRQVVEPLTARELEVLRLLELGLANRPIADRLVVTVGTVKRHTGNIYGKLGVDSRVQAVLRAKDLGLI